MTIPWTSRSPLALLLLASIPVGAAQAMHGAFSPAHVAIEIALSLPLAWVALAIGSRSNSMRVPATASTMAVALVPGTIVHSWLAPRLAPGTHGSAHGVDLGHVVGDAIDMAPYTIAAAILAWWRPSPVRHRRAFAFGLASVALVATLGGAPASASHVAFTQPLAIPPVLTDENISIDMREADVQILPGPSTKMWTYNGVFPGPTIRRPSGSTTRVTFTNNLPAERHMPEATVHHHGNHSSSDDDGQPADLLIPVGGSRTYNYDFFEDGAPERAAFQWYHDHRMDVTGRNVWMGLAGMVILDDEFEQTLDLPSGAFDVPLMVLDRDFDSSNQLSYTFNPSGVQGQHVLVNGVSQPYFAVGDRKYRLRLLNASNLRPYDFALTGGLTMTQIATESGLLPAPIQRTHLRLGPGERAEVVVDFAGKLGQSFEMRNLLGFNSTTKVMRFDVTQDMADDSSIPTTLRPLPEPHSQLPATRRTWVLGAEPDPLVWTINGLPYDPNRVDTAPLNPMLDSTERWTFVNATTAEHMIHIHDVDWRIVNRITTTPLDAESALAEASLKETFWIRPFEVIEVEATFTDHLGRYVLHCHLLEHEDRAMMANFEVVPNLAE